MSSSIFQQLLDWDQSLFTLINTKWTNGVLDTIMPWLRKANNWIPFYVVMLVYLFIKKGIKVWRWVILAVINVTVTDQISSSLFKPFFHRLRPCADPLVRDHSRLLLDYCSGGFSFTSSHAANHFGLAMFIFFTLQPLFKKFSGLFFVWAGLIAYAQVYVGVHYPLDILVGGLIGLFTGKLMAYIYNRWNNFLPSPSLK